MSGARIAEPRGIRLNPAGDHVVVNDGRNASAGQQAKLAASSLGVAPAMVNY